MNSHSILKDLTREPAPTLGLKEASRAKALSILDATLADEFVLYVKARNFHWNVSGPRFSELHRFFEEQYGALSLTVDETAERSRALGGRALGSMKELLGKARLTESGGRGLKEEAMLAELLRDHEALARSLRVDLEECGRLGDQGTMDFLTGLLRGHEKSAWMLRSFLS